MQSNQTPALIYASRNEPSVIRTEHVSPKHRAMPVVPAQRGRPSHPSAQGPALDFAEPTEECPLVFNDGDGSGSEQLEYKVEKLNKYGSEPIYAGK